MSRIVVFLWIIVLVGCAKKVEPSVAAINTIFSSKDFTFEFNRANGQRESLSFRSDFLVYKNSEQTYRREISYDEVLLINDFIKKIFELHSNTLDQNKASHYIIKNTAYEVVLVPELEDFYFDALLKTLKLTKQDLTKKPLKTSF